ncbi:MAG: CopG family transcriptional regulator [Cyclobacteriaceae bacterium]|nr:CopG family transcriptional regulator [Cyclobacteriaceae bacterium]MCK5278889.1 CopG family transcriptional regulator [Cyclobacteriaceae bacterium]MCK5369280.1 CopG family transcriptional regulator [Cyclobacteriaceae bacterium]
MKKQYITSSEFEEKFEEGEDITTFLDVEKASRPGLEQRRVSVDFPAWMVTELDRVSKRLGVTRQSVIKIFISDKLKEEGI